jgi:hypothetical protein
MSIVRSSIAFLLAILLFSLGTPAASQLRIEPK